MFNLKQYVTFPTHRLGHTIDVVLTHSDSPLITGSQPNDVKLRDHFLVEFTVGISPIKTEYRTVAYRNTKSLNNLQFCTEIKEGYESIPICNMQDKVTSCHTLMSKVINTHAPLKTKQIKVVPDAPWFDFEYKALRRRQGKSREKIMENRLSRTQE